MRRFVVLMLSVCFLTGMLAGCGKGSSDDVAANTQSDPESAADTSAQKTSAKETDNVPQPSDKPSWKLIKGKKYLDISNLKTAGKDASELFLTEFEGEAVEGYYIEEQTYLIDADTMWRVTKLPFEGNGAIKWLGYYSETYGKPEKSFDGVLHISKMDDPLYVITCMPNEQSSYIDSVRGRKNASILVDPREEHDKITTIGAVYINDGMDIPDDTVITVCLGRMTCALKWQGEDWSSVYDDLPEQPGSFFYLPWQLQGELGTKPLGDGAVKFVDDAEHGRHFEIKLTAADLKKGTHPDPRVDGAVLHFWGISYLFKNISKTGADLEGVAGSYEIWVKEPEYSGYLTCDIGADLRDKNNKVDQAYTGINFSVTSEPRVIYGHNVASDEYDEIMHTREVMELIGISD